MKKLKKLNQKTLYSFPLGKYTWSVSTKGGEGRLKPPLKIKWIGTYERIYRILYRTSEKLWCL